MIARHISMAALLLTIVAATHPQEAARIPPDLIITAIVSRPIHVAKLRPGDTVELKAYYPLISHGKAVIPKGARLTGSVELCERLVPRQRESELIIRVYRADWNGGRALLTGYIHRLLMVRYRVMKSGSREPPCVLDRYGNCRYDERLYTTFTSPPFPDISVKHLAAPAGATMLVSTKRNIALKKGAIVELRTLSE